MFTFLKFNTLDRYRWNERIARIYRLFRNPHRIKELPSGNCPVQCEGLLSDGKWYYFRSRWDRTTFEVAEDESAWMRGDCLFSWKFEQFDGPMDAGWISPLYACLLLDRASAEYFKRK